jgi:hypothetical protein
MYEVIKNYKTDRNQVSVNCDSNNHGGNFQFANVRANRQNFYPNLAFIKEH